MSRRHRVQYSDAIYHVTSRGVNRGDIFVDDRDRQAFLDRVGRIVAKLGWLVYAFALMSNHFHLFFRTPQPDLCRGMQLLLGQYARRFNRAHRRTGALFEGRFRCQVVENESVSLDGQSLRASQSCAPPGAASGRVAMVQLPGLLRSPPPSALGAIRRLARGVARRVRRSRRRIPAVCRIAVGRPPPSPFQDAADGWILGSDSFVARVRRLISPQSNDPSAQRAR